MKRNPAYLNCELIGPKLYLLSLFSTSTPTDCMEDIVALSAIDLSSNAVSIKFQLSLWFLPASKDAAASSMNEVLVRMEA